MDDNDHGTHCAGIAAADGELKGVAPGASLYAYKVLNSDGFGALSDIIAAVEASLDPNSDGNLDDSTDVISLSLGTEGQEIDNPLDVAINNAVDSGVIVVAAAGNSGPDNNTIFTPGTAAKAITVGAYCMEHQIGVEYHCDSSYIASFSSRGYANIYNKPDIIAPGVEINSTIRDSQYGTESGTSTAAPHVAGTAALLKQKNPSWGPLEIKAALEKSANSFGYRRNVEGAGKLNASAAITINNTSVALIESVSGLKLEIVDMYKRGAVGGAVELKGTVSGDDFSYYNIEWGIGLNPDLWSKDHIELANNGTIEINNSTLGVWNASLLDEDFYILRLEAYNSQDQLLSSDYIYVYVDHVMLIKPVDNSIVDQSMVEVFGTVNPKNFVSYNVSLYDQYDICLLYTSPSPRDLSTYRMPSSA